MKASLYISAGLQVFIMIIAIKKAHGNCNGDLFDCPDYIYEGFDLGGGQQNADYGQQPGQDYNFQQNYDYTIDEGADLEYECYSCVFHVRKGNYAGLDNCRDPFMSDGIPLVPCQGACTKIYHKTSETEYTVTRTCLPNCKEVKDEKGYTQCCWGQLCNGSNSMNMMQGHFLTLFLGLLISSLLAALR